MKKLLCLIIASLMLLAVACTEESVGESSLAADESITDISKDTSGIVSSDTQSSETESAVSQETSNESSEPPYVFKPMDNSYGFAQCDHGAVLKDNWFHLLHNPIVDVYDPNYTYRATGLISMSQDEFKAWLISETPEEYKFECTVHDTNISSTDYRDSQIELYKNKNIVMFLRQHNIDKETFIRDAQYNWQYYYGMYHDPDVLFDWDYQDACNWYLDYYNKYREILEAKSVLWHVKEACRMKYNWDIDVVSKPLAQLIYEWDIPREYIEEKIEYNLNKKKSGNEKLHTGEVVISYKLDDVYNQSDEFMELLEKVENGEIYPLEIDDWFIEVQYN